MYKNFFKRMIDFCITLVALSILLIPLAIITFWLHFANKGAGAFFFQERPGRNGKIFKVVKFKSMTDERDADGNLLPDRERLTKFGSFLRATSIDELPQLFNVLKGDMALIGPRPLLVRYMPYYTEREKLRHSIRPGISGWAQVNGRNNISWDNKLECDAYYAEHVSLWFDIKILWLTFYKVIKRDGAVADKKENYLDVERKNR
jgi:undecaprenyl phosphate N,N'-diacetylbacillosamine 1-phosphate transferase